MSSSNVVLFNTCLAEEFFPGVPGAVAAVLEGLGIRVRPLRRAFCCGQAPFNEGLRERAIGLARRFLNSVKPEAPIIVPSGSCASMIRNFYPDLLANEPKLTRKAAAIRPWVHEFSQFLVNVMKVKYVGARYERPVTYHSSCHLLRELRVADEPLMLLSAVDGIRLCELRDRGECCGFGGLFSVKFPHISVAMLEDKLARIRESGADTVVSADCGCLMQIGGGLHRHGDKIETRHLAEILASR
ncbi:MAG: (Fe-S)-binding protein [Candidatus Binataceae bacterium]